MKVQVLADVERLGGVLQQILGLCFQRHRVEMTAVDQVMHPERVGIAVKQRVV